MIRGGHVTLSVSDVGRAVRFYVETLGMKLIEEAADGSAVIDAGEGFLVALRSPASPSPASSSPASSSPAGPAEEDQALATSSHITFHPKVALDDAIAIFENRGISFTIDRAAGGVTMARFRDPDGNVLVLQAR